MIGAKGQEITSGERYRAALEPFIRIAFDEFKERERGRGGRGVPL